MCRRVGSRRVGVGVVESHMAIQQRRRKARAFYLLLPRVSLLSRWMEVMSMAFIASRSLHECLVANIGRSKTKMHVSIFDLTPSQCPVGKNERRFREANWSPSSVQDWRGRSDPLMSTRAFLLWKAIYVEEAARRRSRCQSGKVPYLLHCKTRFYTNNIALRFSSQLRYSCPSQ